MKFISLKSKTHLHVFVILCTLIAILFTVHFIKQTFEELERKLELNLNNIQHDLRYSIFGARHILYGISLTISKTNIGADDLSQILESFDPKSESIKSIKFSALVVVNKEGKSIGVSTLSKSNFKSLDFRRAKCIEGMEKKPFHLNIGPISLGLYSLQRIIPLGMPIFNKEGEYIGALCTGLSLQQIESDLLEANSDTFIENIEIKQSDNHHEINKENRAISLLKYFYKKDPIFITRNIEDIPYSISIYINKKILKKYIITISYYVLILTSFILALAGIIITYHYYVKPFNKISDTISQKGNKIESTDLAHLFKNNEHNYENIAHSIEQFIEYICNQQELAHIREKEKAYEILDKKITYLALLENHYSPFSKITGYRKDKLLKKTLGFMLKEEAIEINIKDFLNSYIEYITELYDLQITYKLHKNIHLTAKIKYIPFSETFRILFHFIAYGDMFDESAKINISYDDSNSSLLKIKIEAQLLPFNNSIRPIAWENHPNFHYMSLYTIAIIAKENNMLLDIEQKNSKISFTFIFIN